MKVSSVELSGKYILRCNLEEVRAAATSRQDLVLSRTGPGNSDSLSPSAEEQLLIFRRIYLQSHPTIDVVTCVSAAPGGGSIL